MTDVPAGPVAYCAPGQTTAAADLLEANSQTVTKIEEHPWLTGPEVFIVHPEAFRPLSADMPWMEPPAPCTPAWWQETLLRRIGEFAQARSDTGTESRIQPDGLNGPASVGEHPANGPL